MSLKTLDFLLEFREKQSTFPGVPRTVRRCSEVLLVLSSEKSQRMRISGEKTACSSALEMSLQSDFLQCFLRGIYAISGMFVLF